MGSISKLTSMSSFSVYAACVAFSTIGSLAGTWLATGVSAASASGRASAPQRHGCCKNVFMCGMLHAGLTVRGADGGCMAKRLVLCLLIVLAGLYGVNAAAPERYTFSEPQMGTLFKVVLYAPDAATAKKAAAAAFARVAALNRIMSDYLPDSELMRLCKQAGGPPVEVSAELFEILQQAEKFSEMTGGAFDVTVSPVVRLWRRARRTRQLPKPEELQKALALVDFHKLRLDPNGRKVQLLLAGMLLDLGSIAKGYAADAALAVLRQHGITQALVAAGGDIAVGEAPPDAPAWKVGIAPLKDPSAPPTHYLLLTNAGVSTAGDAEQYVEIDGKRYSHIIDPKTGV